MNEDEVKSFPGLKPKEIVEGIQFSMMVELMVADMVKLLIFSFQFPPLSVCSPKGATRDGERETACTGKGAARGQMRDLYELLG
jgi:hypothetical protein